MGHVLVVGAIDRRVKCVVSQVPLCSGYENISRLVRADLIAPTRAQLDMDREARFAGNPPAMIPVVTNDPAGLAALPTADSYQWFTETGSTRAPAWKNEVTLRTVEMLMEYEPGSYVERISPTPLLMIIGAYDHVAIADEAFATFNLAREPKKLVILPGGHFEPYVGPGFKLASGAARNWFVQHLISDHPLS